MERSILKSIIIILFNNSFEIMHFCFRIYETNNDKPFLHHLNNFNKFSRIYNTNF